MVRAKIWFIFLNAASKSFIFYTSFSLSKNSIFWGGIEKFPKENGEGKFLMKMRIKSWLTTYKLFCAVKIRNQKLKT